MKIAFQRLEGRTSSNAKNSYSNLSKNEGRDFKKDETRQRLEESSNRTEISSNKGDTLCEKGSRVRFEDGVLVRGWGWGAVGGAEWLKVLDPHGGL